MTCAICGEPILVDDPDGHHLMRVSVMATPKDFAWSASDNDADLVHVACLIRSVIGSVAHQQRRCSCFGGNDRHRPNDTTFRESAIAAWKYFVEHTVSEEDEERRARL